MDYFTRTDWIIVFVRLRSGDVLFVRSGHVNGDMFLGFGGHSSDVRNVGNL